jgi:hypothetical protein
MDAPYGRHLFRQLIKILFFFCSIIQALLIFLREQIFLLMQMVKFRRLTIFRDLQIFTGFTERKQIPVSFACILFVIGKNKIPEMVERLHK